MRMSLFQVAIFTGIVTTEWPVLLKTSFWFVVTLEWGKHLRTDLMDQFIILKETDWFDL